MSYPTLNKLNPLVSRTPQSAIASPPQTWQTNAATVSGLAGALPTTSEPTQSKLPSLQLLQRLSSPLLTAVIHAALGTPPAATEKPVCGIASTQGRRPTMDDAHATAIIPFEVDGTSYKAEFFALFDGHGKKHTNSGSLVANYCAEMLPIFMTQQLQKVSNISKESITASIDEAFEAMNDALLGFFHASQGGSTALVAVRINGDLWLANLGDSRAIFLNQTHAISLTEDARVHFSFSEPGPGQKDLTLYPHPLHFTTSREERHSICIVKKAQTDNSDEEDVPLYVNRFAQEVLDLKGNIRMVIKHSEDGRPIAQIFRGHDGLMPTAVLGDLHVKEKMDPSPISQTPEITYYSKESLPSEGHIALVCDGITDVLTSDALIKSYPEQKPDPQTLANTLVNQAYHAGSSDNLSAMTFPI